MAKVKAEAVAGLKAQIDAAVSEADGIPGVVFYAVNKNGEYIFEHESGKVGLGKQQDMTADNVFWMASCTKMIVGIACMQLVEQGKLDLDSVEHLEKLAPELRDIKVLQPDGTLVDKKVGITLRMLLTHTAGFSYSFFNEALANFMGPAGLTEASGRAEDYTKQPLVHQPGETWDYGIGIDWAGILVSRASGLSLDDYFKKYITGPLGIDKDLTFLPDEQMRKDLAWTHLRDPTGKLKIRDDGCMLRAPLVSQSAEENSRIFQAGGAGSFSRPKAYTQIIATLLNDGVHAPSGNRILKTETVEQMFTNQIPDRPDFARAGSQWVKPEYANPSPEIYPEPGNPPQGWGLTFFLHLEDSLVHSKGTGWWAGLPNLFWWCDRTKGIGGIIGSQIVPFGDLKVIGLWGGIEYGLYSNLEQGWSKSLEDRTV